MKVYVAGVGFVEEWEEGDLAAVLRLEKVDCSSCPLRRACPAGGRCPVKYYVRSK